MYTEQNKTLLIYNPTAGKNRAATLLDAALESYGTACKRLDIKRSNHAGDITNFIASGGAAGYDSILAMGGDGTINEVMNGILEHDLNIPLGIISCGTANDFSRYLGLPSNPRDCFPLFLQNNIREVDVGIANGKPFINVCAVGLFSHGYMTYDPRLKKAFGKAHYYFKSATDSIAFKPATLRLTANDFSREAKFQLVLVLNSTGTGGFPTIAKGACASDGLLDVVAIKATPATAMPALLVKVLSGDILSDRNVLYFQTDKLDIELLDKSRYFEFCDIDGDRGPALPLHISVKHKALKVLV